MSEHKLHLTAGLQELNVTPPLFHPLPNISSPYPPTDNYLIFKYLSGPIPNLKVPQSVKNIKCYMSITSS